MSSRQSKAKLRPIDPSSGRSKAGSLTRSRSRRPSSMRSNDILAICSTLSSNLNPARCRRLLRHIKKEISDDYPSILRTPHPGNAVGGIRKHRHRRRAVARWGGAGAGSHDEQRFRPRSPYVYKPRHRQAAIVELHVIKEVLRHRVFTAGFLRLPDNGAQVTFQRLCETRAEMLHEALRTEWTRCYSKMIDVSKMRSPAAIELLHKLMPPARLDPRLETGGNILMARKHLHALETPSTNAVKASRNVLIYVRVSTDAQAQNALSLMDQENQLVARCKRDSDNIVGVFRDEGETATNMKRPAFEQMIARATDGTRSVDAILVYSFSRAFRNQFEQELTVRALRKHKVELISFAEPLTKDASGDLFRKFIGIVNEFQSAETARATTRTMKENARRGYLNGGIIPFGYKSVDAEIIGN